jgi:hypothetical protein
MDFVESGLRYTTTLGVTPAFRSCGSCTPLLQDFFLRGPAASAPGRRLILRHLGFD